MTGSAMRSSAAVASSLMVKHDPPSPATATTGDAARRSWRPPPSARRRPEHNTCRSVQQRSIPSALQTAGVHNLRRVAHTMHLQEAPSAIFPHARMHLSTPSWTQHCRREHSGRISPCDCCRVDCGARGRRQGQHRARASLNGHCCGVHDFNSSGSMSIRMMAPEYRFQAGSCRPC